MAIMAKVFISFLGTGNPNAKADQPGYDVLDYRFENGSICVSGSYPSNSESKECRAASPRFLMLCKNSKKAR
jgi:hypothetical protein